MPLVFEGDLSAAGLRVAIVASRFNDEIVEALLAGAVECLERHGAASEAIHVYRVPGAFEIPATASEVARTGRYDAVVTIGCLIRGETPHFDFISAQTTDQISQVAIATRVPMSFGVVTCDTLEQARARATRGNNKGWEAALAAIELATLHRRINAGGV